MNNESTALWFILKAFVSRAAFGGSNSHALDLANVAETRNGFAKSSDKEVSL